MVDELSPGGSRRSAGTRPRQVDARVALYLARRPSSDTSARSLPSSGSASGGSCGGPYTSAPVTPCPAAGNFLCRTASGNRRRSLNTPRQPPFCARTGAARAAGRASVPGFSRTHAGILTGATRPRAARSWPYQPAGSAHGGGHGPARPTTSSAPRTRGALCVHTDAGAPRLTTQTGTRPIPSPLIPSRDGACCATE
jgi:hypothetical protein